MTVVAHEYSRARVEGVRQGCVPCRAMARRVVWDAADGTQRRRTELLQHRRRTDVVVVGRARRVVCRIRSCGRGRRGTRASAFDGADLERAMETREVIEQAECVVTSRPLHRERSLGRLEPAPSAPARQAPRPRPDHRRLDLEVAPRFADVPNGVRTVGGSKERRTRLRAGQSIRIASTVSSWPTRLPATSSRDWPRL